MGIRARDQGSQSHSFITLIHHTHSTHSFITLIQHTHSRYFLFLVRTEFEIDKPKVDFDDFCSGLIAMTLGSRKVCGMNDKPTSAARLDKATSAYWNLKLGVALG